MRRRQTLLSTLSSAKVVGPLGLALTLALGVPTLSAIPALLCAIGAVFFGALTVIGFWQSFNEKRRDQAALETWRNKIDQWASDKDNPLVKAPADDLRRRSARNLTLEVLRKQDAEGRRDVLLALHSWPLIQRFPYPVINLEHADFNGANLEGVDLRGASLKRVHVRDANLRGACLGQGPEDASTTDKLAKAAKFFAGDFWNYSKSCDLRDADLGEAILKDADLVECKLIGANFEGADFCRADLQAADLREARNLAQEQIDKAYGSYEQEDVSDTRLPDNRKAPESWRKSIHEQRREKARARLGRLERVHAGP